MSEKEPTLATSSIMEQLQAMFTQMRDSINNNNINNKNNNINDINNTMNHNNDSLQAEINNNNNKFDYKFDIMQALNEAGHMKLLDLIDHRSRRSTRASTRATLRAVSLKSLVAQVSAKLESGVQEPPVIETPRINSFGPDLSLTQVFRDKDAADNFAEANAMHLKSQIEITLTRIETPTMRLIVLTTLSRPSPSQGQLLNVRRSWMP